MIYALLVAVRAVLPDAAVRDGDHLAQDAGRYPRRQPAVAAQGRSRFDAWVKAWGTACTGVDCGGLKGNFMNSVSFVVPAVLISTLIGAFNGYVLTMWRFRGSDVLFTLLLLGCFIPFQVVLLPMAQTLGYSASPTRSPGLIFVHVVYGLAFTTLFFRNFYVTVPAELTKAARIDGAGFFTIFWRIILPLSPPIIVVCVIWQFTQIWNDFLFGVVFSSGAAAADHRGAEQPGQHLHRRQGIQRGHGGGHHRRRCRRCSCTSSPASISCAASPPARSRAENKHGRALHQQRRSSASARCEVLKGIDIEVEDGEFLILVGPSGCGKSTLLNMIAGLDTHHQRARSRSAGASSTTSRPRTATSRWCSSPTRCIRTCPCATTSRSA